MSSFTKPFTQQEAIPQNGIDRAVEILQSGRLHRYNLVEGEASEASLLEQEYARYQGADYCLACTSGGYAIALALRVVGVKPGDQVLANAYTLAPVPGAIHNVGATPVLIEIDDNYHIDCDDLEAKAASSGAKVLLLSHMRGHIADMDRITSICDAHGITLVEDCAHTMGATWRGIKSGNFGKVAAFSTQTYKHMNSGEGGLLTTNDPELAARAVVSSGSYMLYGRHGAIPAEDVFQKVRLEQPNYSGRMDHLRAAILRAQLPLLDENIRRWNSLYNTLHARFSAIERGYEYRILNRRAHPTLNSNHVWWVGSSLNADAMNDAAQTLVGKHDFSTFRAAECQSSSPVKTIDKITVARAGDNIFVSVRARSFLHHQVRNIVGTLKYVGDGKWTKDDVQSALEKRDRAAGGPTAPAAGLFLTHVCYPD